MRKWKQLSCYTLAMLALSGCQSSSTWTKITRFGRGPSETERVEQLLDEARDLEVDGKIAEARAAYMDILSASPENQLASQRLEMLKKYAPENGIPESGIMDKVAKFNAQEFAENQQKALLTNNPVAEKAEEFQTYANNTKSAFQNMEQQAEQQWQELDQFLAQQNQAANSAETTSVPTQEEKPAQDLSWADQLAFEQQAKPKARLLLAPSKPEVTEPEVEFPFDQQVAQAPVVTEQPSNETPSVTPEVQQVAQAAEQNIPAWAAEWGNQDVVSQTPAISEAAGPEPVTVETEIAATERPEADQDVPTFDFSDASEPAEQLASGAATAESMATQAVEPAEQRLSTIQLAAQQTNPLSALSTPPSQQALETAEVTPPVVVASTTPTKAVPEDSRSEPNPFAQLENFMTWIPSQNEKLQAEQATEAAEAQESTEDQAAVVQVAQQETPAAEQPQPPAKLLLTSSENTTASVVKLSTLSPEMAPISEADAVPEQDLSAATDSVVQDPALVAQLQSTNDQHRREAIDAVASMGPQGAIYRDDLLAIQRNGSGVDQTCAAWALLKTEAELTQSLNLLEQNLGSERSDLVQLSAYLIGDAGYEDSTTQLALSSLMRNSDPMVRLHAAEALLKLDESHPEAIEVLFNLLDDSDFNSKWLAAHALSEAQGTSARLVVARLTRTLKESDAKTKAAAALSLGSFGEQARSAKVALLKMRVSSDEDLRFAAETALACIRDAEEEESH